MDDKKLRKHAEKESVPIGTIEKDYTITNILTLISSFSKLDKMVFKGGTALKKIHFADFRFSEDIDFTCSEDVSTELGALLEDRMHDMDVNVTGITQEETAVEKSRQFVVKYKGYNNYPNSVKIDLSLRESVQNGSSNLAVLHDYDELPKFKIPTMTLQEIMAEKVRAVIYSAAPRHLYDLNFLFGKRIQLNPDLVRKKISLYGDEFSLDRFNRSISRMETRWKKDLERLLPEEPPQFNEISTNVLQKISEIM
ncbi:nucleotidyl transferase AbiEii/AbiGii toxin family protein [Candidatus Nitrosotenuis uzonensis]|nr:nucleotidyl transferase AbiEii/AbiGii toxin family protein [Candidatus Nitrosotenuis uzonensis]